MGEINRFHLVVKSWPLNTTLTKLINNETYQKFKKTQTGHQAMWIGFDYKTANIGNLFI